MFFTVSFILGSILIVFCTRAILKTPKRIRLQKQLAKAEMEMLKKESLTVEFDRRDYYTIAIADAESAYETTDTWEWFFVLIWRGIPLLFGFYFIYLSIEHWFFGH